MRSIIAFLFSLKTFHSFDKRVSNAAGQQMLYIQFSSSLNIRSSSDSPFQSHCSKESIRLTSLPMKMVTTTMMMMRCYCRPGLVTSNGLRSPLGTSLLAPEREFKIECLIKSPQQKSVSVKYILTSQQS